MGKRGPQPKSELGLKRWRPFVIKMSDQDRARIVASIPAGSRSEWARARLLADLPPSPPATGPEEAVWCACEQVGGA